jgi:DNA-binding Xre family transcriptional regulator
VRLRQQAQVTRELVAHHTGMSITELAAVAGVTEARVRQLRKAC